jgi:acetyl esterase/lipase
MSDTTLAPTTATPDTTTTTAAPTTTTTTAATTAAPTTTTTTAATTTVPLVGLGPFNVSSTVVSHETTRDIWVWAPEADGSWPVAYLITGAGSGEDLAEMATRLASHGTVVFAPDYRRNDSATKLAQDLECAYRFALSIAHEYGGDLDQPVTMIGDSYGASIALAEPRRQGSHGPDGDYDVCFTGPPRADIVVAIGGCYYEYEGQEAWQVIDVIVADADTAKLDTELILLVGEDDDVCQPWQSEDATESLNAAGYNARVVVVTGGDHGNMVFWRVVDGEWVTAPNDPVGRGVVQIILDAIDAARP